MSANETLHACRSILLVDNGKLAKLGGDMPGVIVFTQENKAERWAAMEPGAITFEDAARTVAGLPAMYAEKVHNKLADFEQHLEDIGSKDWFNQGLIS